MEDPTFATLETDRLVIRRFRDEDVPAFVAYRNDPEVAELQGWDLPYAASEAMDFIESLRGLAPGTPGTWFQFAVGLDDNGLLIGDVALRTTPEDPSQAELGFSFATAHQGRGYAGEAVRAVIEYAFTILRMQRVFAITDSGNARARKLLEHLEFQLEQQVPESALLYSVQRLQLPTP